jgi:nucleolar MIF4G domain-containing protein 1
MRKTQLEDDDSDQERRRAILRCLNNALNRLSEDTLISVAQQVAAQFTENPTQMVHEMIWKNAKDACVSPSMLMTGLIPVYVACIVGVHIQTGDIVQVGESILESIVVDLWKALETCRNRVIDMTEGNEKEPNDGENKQICNMMLMLGYLYNYNIVHCSFMYDVVRHLIENFSDVDIECLLILLSHCGRSLRSDDPSALKEIVLLVQKKKIENSKKSSSSRADYMISAIMDLKNNRRKKQDADHSETVTKFRKSLGRIKTAAAKSGVSKSSSEASLRISLNDILNAEQKGRWWKVGASWVGNQYRFSDDTADERKSAETVQGSSNDGEIDKEEQSQELIQLASKLRMNTDRKRAIFFIIMGGTDCEDTFEKLCRSSMLQNRSERDTVRVVMECCGSEKSYNKFYGHLAARICEYQPQSKFSLQLAYWDAFKQFSTMGARKAANLAKFLFHLVVTHRSVKLLPVIKTIDVSDDDTDETAMIFLTIVLSSVLDHFDDPQQAKALFARHVPASPDASKHDEEDEGIRAGLFVFFMETLKSSPKNQKGSRFRKNFKAIVKELDSDGFESMF